MKIKLMVPKEKLDKYQKMLEKAGFIIDEDATLILKEEGFYPKYFLGKKEHTYEIVNVDEVVLIESFGRDIFLSTKNSVYNIKLKLYEIEENYNQFGLIRINKSQIINRKYIKKIRPLLNSRIKIFLYDNRVLEVTRTYVEQFREHIGF